MLNVEFLREGRTCILKGGWDGYIRYVCGGMLLREIEGGFDGFLGVSLCASRL